MVKRVLVVFDFDHTLVDENSDTYILRLLPDGGEELPPNIKKLYSVHGWNDYQAAVLRHLHSNQVTPQQLLSCASEMPFVDGMPDLLQFLSAEKTSAKPVEKNGIGHVASGAKGAACSKSRDTKDQHSVMNGNASTVHANGVDNGLKTSAAGASHAAVNGHATSSASDVHFEAIIISDANSAVINHVLDTAGLQSVFSKIYTNPSSFDHSGCLRLTSYHQQDWCTMSPANMCKGHILNHHRSQSDVNYDVIAYIGDGSNDFCPTLHLRDTDVVFPRRRFSLVRCIGEGRDKVAAKVRSWDTGLDILNGLKEVLVTA